MKSDVANAFDVPLQLKLHQALSLAARGKRAQ
jgi:hypothetical protein